MGSGCDRSGFDRGTCSPRGASPTCPHPAPPEPLCVCGRCPSNQVGPVEERQAGTQGHRTAPGALGLTMQASPTPQRSAARLSLESTDSCLDPQHQPSTGQAGHQNAGRGHQSPGLQPEGRAGGRTHRAGRSQGNPPQLQAAPPRQHRPSRGPGAPRRERQ